MFKNALNLYTTLLAICFTDYNSIINEEKEEIGKRYDPSNLKLGYIR